AGERLALEDGESGARFGKGVDAHAEGGHQEAAGDADHAERQNDDDLVRRQTQHETEVKNDDYRHEAFQDAEESALGGEVGFAGFVISSLTSRMESWTAMLRRRVKMKRPKMSPRALTTRPPIR